MTRPSLPGRTVASLLARHVEGAGGRLAVGVDDERVTWEELGDAVARASRFLHDVGLRPGDHVSILMPNCIDWAVWAFACGCLGLPLVPANTKLRAGELRYQLEQSDSVALVLRGQADGELLELAEEALGVDTGGRPAVSRLRAVITLGHIDRPWAVAYQPPPAAGLPDQAGPDDILLIQYTSGTTALPKGAMLSHRSVLQDAAGVAARLRINPERDRYLSPSPFHHSAGSTVLLYLGLVSGAPVYSTSRFDPEGILAMMERERITIYGGIDALWVGICKAAGFSPRRLRTVEKGWIAATPSLVTQIQELSGVPALVNLYGLSEASPNVTIADVAWPPEERLTCGKPHSGFEVRVVDPESRRPLAPGRRGEIEVRGPCLMAGYYGKPKETADAIDPEGWLHTGDRGYLRPDGNLVYEGRYKHMLRVGGENVAAAEVEAVLLSHPDIADVAVIGIPDERLGEVPAAAVVPRPGRQLRPEEVTDYAAQRLADFKVTRLVRIVDDLPKTGSGRVQKFRLLDLFTTREA